MDALIAHLKGRGLSGATVNRYLAVVSRVLNYACTRVRYLKPKIERESEAERRIRWITGTEERALLAFCRQIGRDAEADAITVLIDTGMRPGELWKLEARDVNLGTGAIHIWENKTAKPRTIYATPRVHAILASKVQQKPGTRLFPVDDWWLRTT